MGRPGQVGGPERHRQERGREQQGQGGQAAARPDEQLLRGTRRIFEDPAEHVIRPAVVLLIITVCSEEN